VCDTNVVVSAALFPSSVPGQAFRHARGSGRILTTPTLAAELHEVLSRPKFARYVTAELWDEFLAAFFAQAEFVRVIEHVILARDPDDDHVLDAAINGNATCVITGDDDLLTLSSFRGIPILRPADYLNRYGASPEPRAGL
jgi:putative PIN family toxin of toxin-antitoxin system